MICTDVDAERNARHHCTSTVGIGIRRNGGPYDTSPVNTKPKSIPKSAPGLIKHQNCKAANQDPAQKENKARASTHWRADISITIVTTYRRRHSAAASVVQQP